MERKDWPRCIKEMDIEEYNYPSFFGFKDGYFTIILENFDDKKDKTRVKWNGKTYIPTPMLMSPIGRNLDSI